VVNLTAIIDPVEVAVKHFVDSLTVEAVWSPKPGDHAIDIGTGGGFPGIPLAIRHPEVTFLLTDSVRKKVDFLSEVVKELPLVNVQPHWGRAEELARNPQNRGQYNFAFARAVAHLAILIEYAIPLLKIGGRLIAMKGPSGATEIEESAPALASLKASIREVRRFSLPDAGDRMLIVIEKDEETPAKYPRDTGLIKKKPLYLDTGRGTT
jgi:16S rRNA (guanine527-N7)-methyltransferase